MFHILRIILSINCKSRNFTNTDVRTYSIDLRLFLRHPVLFIWIICKVLFLLFFHNKKWRFWALLRTCDKKRKYDLETPCILHLSSLSSMCGKTYLLKYYIFCRHRVFTVPSNETTVKNTKNQYRYSIIFICRKFIKKVSTDLLFEINVFLKYILRIRKNKS